MKSTGIDTCVRKSTLFPVISLHQAARQDPCNFSEFSHSVVVDAWIAPCIFRDLSMPVCLTMREAGRVHLQRPAPAQRSHSPVAEDIRPDPLFRGRFIEVGPRLLPGPHAGARIVVFFQVPRNGNHLEKTGKIPGIGVEFSWPPSIDRKKESPIIITDNPPTSLFTHRHEP